MTTKLAQAVEALQSLPQERQDELAEILTDIAMPTIQYTADEKAAIAEGQADAEAGRFVSDTELQATFARFGAA